MIRSPARVRRAATALAASALVLGGPVMAAQPAAGAAQSPPTTNPLQGLLNKLTGATTTTAPHPTSPGSPGSPAGKSPAPPGAPAPSAKPLPPPAPPAGPGAIPPSALAQINSIKRTGGSSTAQLMAALQGLVDVGLSPQEAAVIGMGHFPVAGLAAYSDDFLAPRFTPTFHLHQGNDIFADRGTPVRAPFDGVVSGSFEPVGGNDIYVRTGDGTYYFGAHLDHYANLPGGSSVKQGQIIGYVGNTGDAQGGSPHLHFEIHPKGGPAVNPKPILDGWLAEALANIPNILATYQVGLPRPIVDAGMLRRFDEPMSGGADAEAVLAASGAKSTGVSRLSELRAVRAGDAAAATGPTSVQVIADQWQAARQTSAALLDPMTPPVLSRVLSPDSNSN